MPDREKIIKEAEEILSYVLPDEKDTSGIMVKVGWIRDVLALLKEQNGWRLCSEELPETEDEVLTTYIVNGNQKKRYVETASYFNEGDREGHWNSVWDEYRVSGTKIEVIAWMPLPKPYRQ